MINIRRGTFETNSSSAHAICVHNDKNIKIPSYIFFGLEDLEAEYSHWYEGGHWNTIQGRANYLHTIMVMMLPKTKYVESKTRLTKWLKELGVKSEWAKVKWSEDGESFASKQFLYEIKDTCSDTILNIIIEDKEKLRNYLFGKNSDIIIGYDDYFYENLKKAQKLYPPESEEYDYYEDEY
ncbi:MAG: hypothetical protein J6T10_24295 [Methanobrevibacter sp.]|nr:hypothetical protein [Methanobrevibacter sp.]